MKNMANKRIIELWSISIVILLVIVFGLTITSNAFEVSEDKILATHFFSKGWAPDFWSYLNIHKVGAELEAIKADGFNTVILVVPWAGFQPSIDPLIYNQEYLDLLDKLLTKIESNRLKVILRLGYAHDNSAKSIPPYGVRIISARDQEPFSGWLDYLERIWNIVKKYDNFLFGFISWEDISYLDFTHLPLEQRLKLASQIGYQEYLKKYQLDKISKIYGKTYSAYSEIPVPEFNSKNISLFSSFWDDLLVNEIFKASRERFPHLSMEVRVDCDPEDNFSHYVCHDKTFDLLPDTNVTVIYYSPGWAAPNNGDRASAKEALERMAFMINHVRSHTNNRIFIDQLNFIDNTPGFEQNTIIAPKEISAFLEGAFRILRDNTIGYSIWTIRDRPANIFKNGSFERDYLGWDKEEGIIRYDSYEKEKFLILKSGGKLSQTFADRLIPHSEKRPIPFHLDFRAKTPGKEGTVITISIFDSQKNNVYDKQMKLTCPQWESFKLKDIPFDYGHHLEIKNNGSELFLDKLYFYAWSQEGGIYDSQGNPKSFQDDIKVLNRNLATNDLEITETFFDESKIKDRHFRGVYPDLWVGSFISGKIAVPKKNPPWNFLVKAYVPENWVTYKNIITLKLGGQNFGSKTVLPGYNEISFEIPAKAMKRRVVSFDLVLDKVFAPQKYDVKLIDNRKVSILIIEFGFVDE
jgi:hypothetical protein